MKKQLGLISEQLCTCSTLFCILCRYFARLQQETFRNFLITTGYTFYGGNVILVLVHFLYWRSFSPWWPLACTQTLFYFSFRSFRKHRRARKGERESERLFSTSSIPTPLHWRSVNPPRFLFFITCVRRTLGGR